MYQRHPRSLLAFPSGQLTSSVIREYKLTIALAYAVLLSLLFLFTSVSAEDYVDLVKRGNQEFTNGNYDVAREQYHKAETKLPESPELHYNLAGAAYKLGEYELAVEGYSKAFNTADIAVEAQAHYNLGNTYFRMGDYQNAIKSFENSLNINPDDLDAKFNLELARKMLKEQTKPEQQEQQQQQQQQQQEQKQDQQQQDQQNQKQQDQENQGESNQDQQQQQQQQQPKDEISKEDAERILNALRDDEQDIQKKIKRQVSAGSYSGRDW